MYLTSLLRIRIWDHVDPGSYIRDPGMENLTVYGIFYSFRSGVEDYEMPLKIYIYLLYFMTWCIAPA
jgi:hypothetical protein